MSDLKKIFRASPNLFAGSGVSKETINMAENALKVRFSDEYTEYLSEFGTAALNGHELTGVCESPRLSVVDVTTAERVYNPGVPSEWYVIEQANIDGIVIWQSQSGEVYQTMPGGHSVKLCDSLRDYIGE